MFQQELEWKNKYPQTGHFSSPPSFITANQKLQCTIHKVKVLGKKWWNLLIHHFDYMRLFLTVRFIVLWYCLDLQSEMMDCLCSPETILWVYLSTYVKRLMISGVYPTCFHNEDNYFLWQEHDKVTVWDKHKDLDVQVSYFMFCCRYFA